MTPKEKAKNIYNNYLIDVKFTMEDCSFTYRGNNYELCVKKTAKQCALIVVDEVINSGLLMMIEDEEYWNEVKQEIKKL